MSPLRRRPDRRLNCRQVGHRLQRYLDGELDDLTARRIVRHLEACRRCGMELAAYTEIKASLARQGHDVPGEALTRLREFGERLVREGSPADVDLPDETAGG